MMTRVAFHALHRFRLLLALWLGKIAFWLSRLAGRGGSSLPGRVARLVYPGILTALAYQTDRGNVVITGTNGKTTTANMVAGILRVAGWRYTHNRTGANLVNGLTSAFLESASPGGRVRSEVGLLEVDEATMPRAVVEVRPRVAVVTNFFRDQLDRYGELEHTVRLAGAALQRLGPHGVAVLNADDPLVAGLGSGLPCRTIYYGIEDSGAGRGEAFQAADAKFCISCGRPYIYEVYYCAHLGRYRCPHCSRRRPDPQVYAHRVGAAGMEGTWLEVSTPAGFVDFLLPVPGLYNVYNALAAISCAVALGLDLRRVREGLASYSSAFGRMEALEVNGRRVRLVLVKNPAGFNEVLRTVLREKGPKYLMLAINDRYADGTDISWLWDVDFELLGQGSEASVFCMASGLRGEDMWLRLKYAGLPPSRLHLESNLREALSRSLERVPPGETLYVLPTYTAMLELREILHRLGYTRKYWED